MCIRDSGKVAVLSIGIIADAVREVNIQIAVVFAALIAYSLPLVHSYSSKTYILHFAATDFASKFIPKIKSSNKSDDDHTRSAKIGLL